MRGGLETSRCAEPAFGGADKFQHADGAILLGFVLQLRSAADAFSAPKPVHDDHAGREIFSLGGGRSPPLIRRHGDGPGLLSEVSRATRRARAAMPGHSAR